MVAVVGAGVGEMGEFGKTIFETMVKQNLSTITNTADAISKQIELKSLTGTPGQKKSDVLDGKTFDPSADAAETMRVIGSSDLTPQDKNKIYKYIL